MTKEVVIKLTLRQAEKVLREMERINQHSDDISYRYEAGNIVRRIDQAIREAQS